MKRLVSFLFVLCLIGFISATGFAEGSAGYQQAYIAMIEELERGHYADAYIAAKIVYEENSEYEQIESYYHYLTALQVYLPREQYKEAYDTFQALALRKFQKSEGYAAYALGCQYEKEKDYESAIEQFRIAYTNNIEALQKIQDCQKKIDEMRNNQAIEITYSANGFAVDTVNARLLDRAYIEYFPGKDDTTRRFNYYETVFNVPENDTTYDLFATPVDLCEIPVKATRQSELVLCLHYIQHAASSETVEGKLILEGLSSVATEKAISLNGFQKAGLIYIGTDELVPDVSLWHAGSYRLILILDGLTAYACNIELLP